MQWFWLGNERDMHRRGLASLLRQDVEGGTVVLACVQIAPAQAERIRKGPMDRDDVFEELTATRHEVTFSGRLRPDDVDLALFTRA
ncbi:MAG: hypothetical protein M3Y57_04090 [Acidobacteriota bacterium]|nr:hypothetical protein [Acidobacteriota bacterium]